MTPFLDITITSIFLGVAAAAVGAIIVMRAAVINADARRVAKSNTLLFSTNPITSHRLELSWLGKVDKPWVENWFPTIG